MTFTTLIILLAIAGIALYFIDMDAKIKQLIVALIVIATVVWGLNKAHIIHLSQDTHAQQHQSYQS